MTNNYPENMNMDELMLNKSFSQLSEEENDFVLEMLGSESEYEEMRSMLLDIKNSFAAEEEIVPDEKIKLSLLQEFNAKHGKNGKIVTLSKNNTILRSPIFQIAAVGLIVIGIGILLFNTDVFKKDELAVNTNDKIIKAEENIQPAVSMSQDSLEPNKTKLSGNILPAAEESKSNANDELKQPVVVESKQDNRAVIIINNDLTVLDDRSDKETENVKIISGNELAKKEEEMKPLKESEKYKKDAYSGSSLKDTSVTLTKMVNTAPASSNRQYAESVVTDNLGGVERKENKKQSEDRDKAPQEKKSNSISLAQKPELIEFLFTAL